MITQLEVSVLTASHADVLKLVTRSSPRTRDKPKNVCVRGYSTYSLGISGCLGIFLIVTITTVPENKSHTTQHYKLTLQLVIIKG